MHELGQSIKLMNIIKLTTLSARDTKIAWRLGIVSLLLAIAVVAITAASSGGVGPPPGQLLASQCFQCHGTDGQAVSGFESITGKSAEDMYHTLLEMSQRRPENIMDMQARAYTPVQLMLIAEYLSTLPEGSEGDGD
jgi:sulfide dehydrogenase cytochrome subunit